MGKKSPEQYDTDLVLDGHPEIAEDLELRNKFFALGADLIRNLPEKLFAEHAAKDPNERRAARLRYNHATQSA